MSLIKTYIIKRAQPDCEKEYLSNLNSKIIIIEERIEDRKANIKGYGKNVNVAKGYLFDLYNAFFQDGEGSQSACYNKSISEFYRVVSKRLDRD